MSFETRSDKHRSCADFGEYVRPRAYGVGNSEYRYAIAPKTMRKRAVWMRVPESNAALGYRGGYLQLNAQFCPSNFDSGPGHHSKQPAELLDVRIIMAMSPQAFTLAGLERVARVEHAQSWLVTDS